VVVDSFSTDDTGAVCAQFGVRLVNIKFEGFGKLRNDALALLKHNWVVSIDSDERSTPEFADEVRRTLAAPQACRVFCSAPEQLSGPAGQFRRHVSRLPPAAGFRPPEIQIPRGRCA